uniref:F-box domain-containing protein n=1 Tax=Panagrolaimus sp. JU765 TaxID=591449 RepID=A0AC34RND5_9BILA
MAPPKRNADTELAFDCLDLKKIRPSEDIDHISQLLQNIEATVKLRNSEISLDSIKNLLVNCGKVLTDMKSKLAFEKSFQETEQRRSFIVQNLPESTAKSASIRINEDTKLVSESLNELDVKAIPESVYRMPGERNLKSDEPSKKQFKKESNFQPLATDRRAEMMDSFNFLGLPLAVQELITNEIVHNSIPEDRIQLALTSKYCNELVQRAKPMKIIDKFWIGFFPRFTFISNSRDYTRTKEQWGEVLRNCQIKHLLLKFDSQFSSDEYSEILDVLPEATKFTTKLDIITVNHLNMKDEVVGFYVKLKHLKSVTLEKLGLILPYYPSKTAKFSIGADICIRNEVASAHFPFHFTYLGQNTFAFEMFPKNFVRIFISQRFVGKNRRILKLEKSFWVFSKIAFNVVSASNPDKNYFCGVFKNEEEQRFILENVDRDEILKVQFVDESIQETTAYGIIERFVRPRYSAEMLESAFPTANFTSPEERVEKINNVLGTNIQLIQANDFVQTVRMIQ